ncbi:25395_t:CDS:1, partial [Racocetra persica]
VSSVMIITTSLLATVISLVWHFPVFVSIIFFIIFGVVDASFLSATLVKVQNGGWLTIAIALLLTFIMLIWRWGTVRKIRHEFIHRPNFGKIFEHSEKLEKEISTDL